MVRRFAVALGVSAGVLLLVHAGLWWLAASWLQREADARFAAESAAGAVIAHRTPVRGGYPFAATVTFPGFAWQGRVQAAGGTGLPAMGRAEAMTLSLSPRDLRRLAVSVTCPCLAGAGFTAPVPLEAAALGASLPLAGEGAIATVSGRDIVLRLPEGPLAIASFEGMAPRGRSATLTVLAVGIVLPPPEAQWPLGSRIATLQGTLTLRGTIPPGPSPARALAAWRDSDGAVALDRVVLGWGPLTVRGAATVALDAALQPRGVANATVAGYGPALDRFVDAGLIGRGQAALARLALTAASRTGDGGERVVDLALSLEDRLLSAARIPLARLPPVIWPDGR